jgi:hypothetical protein
MVGTFYAATDDDFHSRSLVTGAMYFAVLAVVNLANILMFYVRVQNSATINN